MDDNKLPGSETEKLNQSVAEPADAEQSGLDVLLTDNSTADKSIEPKDAEAKAKPFENIVEEIAVKEPIGKFFGDGKFEKKKNRSTRFNRNAKKANEIDGLTEDNGLDAVNDSTVKNGKVKSKRLKKQFVIMIIVAAVLVIAIVTATLCITLIKKPYQFNLRDDVDMTRLEFVSGNYDSSKPTLIYFHGLTDSEARTNLKRPQEYDAVMDKSSSSSDINISLKENLSDYWQENGWNVALFHYEDIAKLGQDDFYEKLFLQNEGMLNEFVNVYRLIFKDRASQFDISADSDKTQRVQEIRFAGVGVGATFAAYASKLVTQLVIEKTISEFYLPWRLTLLNPDLDNALFTGGHSTLSGSFPLEGVEDAVSYAGTFGNVVTEMVESDINYALSYDEPYSEEDKRIYDNLLKNLVCLEINESFSLTNNWSPKLKETVSAVWYLSTIGGSDYDSNSGSSSAQTVRNLLPFINNPRSNYSVYDTYSVSAWTPTSATRLLKGLRFRPSDYNSSETPQYKEKVVTSFRKELFASSFQTQTLARVGGYVFNDKNGDLYLNDGRLASMRGVTVELRYTVSGKEETKVSAVTDSNGFYMFEVPYEAYNYQLYLDFYTPDYRFIPGGKMSATADENCTGASVSGTGQYVSRTWKDMVNVVYNACFRFAEFEKE